MNSSTLLSNGKPISESSSFRASKSLRLVLDEEEEKNNIEDSSKLAGILYKWVNFGKGWRPRWFVLKDGVFSYYKVHGPDKITFAPDRPISGLRIVGDHSIRYFKKHCNSTADESKISGELHLQVSSIRKSKTDEKKFYIFTGTKTLNLRALTREDRNAWLDSLLASKDLLSKFPIPHGLLLPYEGKTIPTNKLRCRLVEEGLSDTAVTECENIMKSEFVKLQEQVKYLQQNYLGLIEKLRLIEAEKIELETTVVDQHLHDRDHSVNFGQERDGSTMDFDEDMEKHGTETDEDDDVYFDTNEIFSHRRKSHSDSLGSLSDIDDATPNPKGASDSSSSDFVDSNYPYVKRRKRLPEPKEKEKETSLWSLIKGSIGMDLTRVCLPVSFNEPISSLQKCFEDLEYSYLLDQASEWGKRGNSLMRLLNVAAFAVSGYASTEDRNCKPFNPLLGETYEADFPDKGVKFFSEKVSHHPMIVACHCDGKGWKFYGDSTVKSKFWGQSIQLDPVGILTLEFDDGEIFQWSKVTTSIYNLILGKVYCDHYGTMRIQGNRELSCRLKFKEQSIMDRNPHQVQGFVHDKNGQKIASLFGKWDEAMYYIHGDISRKPKGYDPMSEAVLLWERNKPPKFSTKYNLTSFAITLNEITPGLKELLPPTDSRLRPDQRHLENGEYEKAFAEKLRLEEKQRMARKQQESGWKPRWFHKDKDTGTYKYVGGYWEARSKRQWDSCPDIFGNSELAKQE